MCKGKKKKKSCNAKDGEIQDNIQRIIIKLGDDSLHPDDSTNEATDEHDDDGSGENEKDARPD